MKPQFLIYISLLFGSCAHIASPTGGPKDEKAPVLISSEPTIETPLKGESLNLEFDEYIKYEAGSFYSSPPIEAKVSHQGKTISIKWDAPLKENTSYQFHFGDGISDFNEGNKTNNFSITFSTGEQKDSLSIKGSVVDALTKETKGGVWAALYIYSDSEQDSVPFQQLPNYLYKTDKAGRFHFGNLKDEDYFLCVLEDEDNNLQHNLASESVGFHSSIIHPLDSNINVELFNESAVADTVSAIHHDSLSNFSSLFIDSLPKGQYVLELLKGDLLVYRQAVSEQTAIDSLLVGEYRLRLITDRNNNGVWDSGNLQKRIEAEKVSYYPSTVKIRKDWDLAISWTK